MIVIKKIMFLILGLILFSCNSEAKKKEQNKEELVMYQASEMTLLMRELFEFQEQSKELITKGELPLNFPEKFKKIHTAKLSDQFERDASFKGFTKMYFQNIEDLGNSTKENAKTKFNKMINTCISCHQTTCDGPIKRIKKLMIK